MDQIRLDCRLCIFIPDYCDKSVVIGVRVTACDLVAVMGYSYRSRRVGYF